MPSHKQKEALHRKNVQLSIETWKEAMSRKADKEKKMAASGHPREVTLNEVVADAFGLEL